MKRTLFRSELGPIRDDVASYTIKKVHGVCGMTCEGKQTIILFNALQSTEYISCASISRSEIVVFVFNVNEVVTVIDVDNKGYSAYYDIDKERIEKIAEILV